MISIRRTVWSFWITHATSLQIRHQAVMRRFIVSVPDAMGLLFRRIVARFEPTASLKDVKAKVEEVL